MPPLFLPHVGKDGCYWLVSTVSNHHVPHLKDIVLTRDRTGSTPLCPTSHEGHTDRGDRGQICTLRGGRLWILLCYLLPWGGTVTKKPQFALT